MEVIGDLENSSFVGVVRQKPDFHEFTREGQLINVQGPKEIENHHVTITIVIIDLSKNHQWMLKPLVKDYWGIRQSQSSFPEITYYYKGKRVSLQWRNVRDTTLT